MYKSMFTTVALAAALAVSAPAAMAKTTVNGQGYKIFHPAQNLTDTRAAGRQARINRRIKNRQRIRNQRIRNRQRNQNRRRHKKGISDGAAVAIGAAALLAIALSSKKHIITKRRAINRCLDRADRRTIRNGGNGVVLRRVNRVRVKHGDWRVSLQVRQVLGGGRGRIVNPYCRISGKRIVKFRMR